MFFSDNKERQTYHEWLKNLKVGDKVSIPRNGSWYNNLPPCILEVEGETPKFFRVNGELYSKEDGQRRGSGSSYMYAFIEPVTPKVIDQVAVYSHRKEIEKNLKFISEKLRYVVGLDDLENINNLIKEVGVIINAYIEKEGD